MDSKKPEVKAKAKAKKETVPMPTMIDWQAMGLALEAELKEKGWNSAMQRRNPQYLQGLVMRHVVRPLVQAIHKQKGV